MRKVMGTMVRVVCAGGLAASMGGCAKAPSQRPVKLGRWTPRQDRSRRSRRDLAGNWTLARLEVIGAGGVRQTVKAHGTLSYDAFGSLIVNGVIDDPRLTNAVVLNYTGRRMPANTARVPPMTTRVSTVVTTT